MNRSDAITLSLCIGILVLNLILTIISKGAWLYCLYKIFNHFITLV